MKTENLKKLPKGSEIIKQNTGEYSLFLKSGRMIDIYLGKNKQKARAKGLKELNRQLLTIRQIWGNNYSQIEIEQIKLLTK